MIPGALATIVVDLDPNLIKLGAFPITWHGVFSVLGILAGMRLGQWLLKRDGVSPDQVYDMAIWMVVVGLIGARALFIWENYRLFAGSSWMHVFYLNEGGISQWGGIFGALIGAYLWCWRNHVSYLVVLDAAGAANAIGFAIGRIGDVINGEHHAIASSLPWAVEYVNPATLGEPGKAVHPEVAYEMVMCLLILAVLLPLHRRLKSLLPAGVTGFVYFDAYAIGRFFLSFLREDSLFMGLRQAQWASVLMVLISAIAITILLGRGRRAWPPQTPEPPAPPPVPPATPRRSRAKATAPAVPAAPAAPAPAKPRARPKKSEKGATA